MQIVKKLDNWLTAFTALLAFILLSMYALDNYGPKGYTADERAAMDALIESVTSDDYLTQLERTL